MSGAFRVRVRSSKTNEDGAETDIRLIKNGAAAALAAIRPADAEPRDKVFAGVNGLTAHSGRVGHASELTVRGASTTEVMKSGGWKTARMVAHYAAAAAEQGAVAKYL